MKYLLSPRLKFTSTREISIPPSDTPHIAPLSSMKPLNEARGDGDLKKSETLYMAMFNVLCGEGEDGNTGPRIQECWGFIHPVKSVINEIRDSGSSPVR